RFLEPTQPGTPGVRMRARTLVVIWPARSDSLRDVGRVIRSAPECRSSRSRHPLRAVPCWICSTSKEKRLGDMHDRGRGSPEDLDPALLVGGEVSGDFRRGRHWWWLGFSAIAC